MSLLNPNSIQVVRFLLVMFSTTFGSVACTSEQLYNTSQGWQREECRKIIDNSEYQRCLSKTDTSYEDYKHQTEENDKNNKK